MIPEGDFRCVWMSAGILSYQLCDRSFDCDHCPLDTAMRQHFLQPPAPQEHAAGGPANARPGLPPGLRYSRCHFWVKPLTSGRVRVGLEEGLAKALLVPGSIILPIEGEAITTSTPCAWVVQQTKTIPFPSCIDGEVTAVNALLSERPYKIFFHPYDQGWLFEAAIAPGTLATLMTAEEAAASYRNDEQTFREKLRAALGGSPQSTMIGATMQDGGEALQDISLMLGPERYFNLLWETYFRKKSR